MENSLAQSIPVLSGLSDREWQFKEASSTLSEKATLTGRTVLQEFVLEIPFHEGKVILTVTTPENKLPTAFVPVAQSLVGFLNLPPNWNTYGSSKIDPSNAQTALKLFPIFVRDGIPTPTVVPTSRGGIQFEWHTKGMDLEIEVSSKPGVHVFYENPATGQSVDDDFPVPSSRLKTVVDRLAAAH